VAFNFLQETIEVGDMLKWQYMPNGLPEYFLVVSASSMIVTENQFNLRFFCEIGIQVLDLKTSHVEVDLVIDSTNQAYWTKVYPT